MQRCSFKAKGISDLIFDISCIREVHQLLVVNKYHKGRRFYSNLCDIVQSEALALVARWLLECNCFCHDLIEHACCNTHGLVLLYHVDQLIQLSDTLSCLC